MEKIRLFSCLIAIFALFACEKQYEQSTDTTVPDISVDESASAFAKILASSMNNSEMLDFIKEMADQRFDGDENFLIMDKLDDKATKSSHTFYDMLASTVTKSSGAYDLDNLVEAIKLNDPLLQVYVMNSELWDSGIEPVVVLLPENYDDERLCTLTVYQMDGKSYKISSEDEIEDAPVVVLSRNERTIVEKTKKEGNDAYYSNDIYDYFLKEHLYTTTNSKKELTTKSSNSIEQEVAALMGTEFTNSYRNLNSSKTDYVTDVTINDKEAWKAIESGWLGDPELTLYIVYGDRSGDDLVIKHKNRLNINDKFEITGNVFKNRNNIRIYPWNQETMTWSLYENGSDMVYAWNEEDNSTGDKSYYVNFSIRWYSYSDKEILSEKINYPFIVDLEDNYAGFNVIEYSDADCENYNSGYISYTINIETK